MWAQPSNFKPKKTLIDFALPFQNSTESTHSRSSMEKMNLSAGSELWPQWSTMFSFTRMIDLSQCLQKPLRQVFLRTLGDVLNCLSETRSMVILTLRTEQQIRWLTHPWWQVWLYETLSLEPPRPQSADTAKRGSSHASLHVVMDSRGCSWAILDPVMRQGLPAGKMSL